MRSCVLLLSALIVTQAMAGPAWRWVDADGTVHYSDRPMPGAVEVFLPDAATPTPVPPQPSRSSVAAAPTASPASAVPVGESTAYSNLTITSPAPDETLWNTGGELTVEVAVAPALQQGHRLTLLYDGAPVTGAASNGTSFRLGDVFRGIHTVQAMIVDASGSPVLRSLPVQFVVQQTSIQNPRNPQRN